MNELNVSENLVFELKRLNLKQKEISDFLGMSLRGIQRWCKEVAIPSDKLGKLAELGIDPYFVATGKRQEINTEVLQESVKVMLPAIKIANADLDTSALMIASSYNTLLKKAFDNQEG